MLEQPSPGIVLPSSKASPGPIEPSPQTLLLVPPPPLLPVLPPLPLLPVLPPLPPPPLPPPTPPVSPPARCEHIAPPHCAVDVLDVERGCLADAKAGFVEGPDERALLLGENALGPTRDIIAKLAKKR